jgi:hypothetical protein
MSQETIHLFIHVGANSNIDNEELDELTRQLSDELSELDMMLVELAQSEHLPVGAKGTFIDIGTILVKIAEFGGIAGLITVLGSWLSRDERRTIKLQIGENSLEVTGLSTAEADNLVQWFKTQTGLQLGT